MREVYVQLNSQMSMADGLLHMSFYKQLSISFLNLCVQGIWETWKDLSLADLIVSSLRTICTIITSRENTSKPLLNSNPRDGYPLATELRL